MSKAVGYRRRAMTHTAVYLRIAGDLRDRIDSGELVAGAAIASERRLSVELGVSRTTARQAVEVLVREGRLFRDGSRGTFVAPPRLGLRIGSFTREVEGHGRSPGARVLSAELVTATALAAEVLGLPRGGQVLDIRRLRTVDGEPLAIEHTVVPAELGVALLGQRLDGSLWSVLESTCGVVAARASVAVEAITLRGRDAELLGVPAGAAALLQTRRTYDTAGRCFEWAQDVYRGDRALLEADADVRTPRQPGAASSRDAVELLRRRGPG